MTRRDETSRLTFRTARHARYDALDTSYVSCRVVSRRYVTSQVEVRL